MLKIRLISFVGIGILAIVAGISAFLGQHLSGPFTAVDQPIIISDGSLYIERKDGGSLKGWFPLNQAQPSDLYPVQAWEGADVTEDGKIVDSCSKTETQCTIDIKYDRDNPSIHFKYTRGDAHPMVITSDYNTYDTWKGYKDHLMYHPISEKIKAVNNKNYSGNVQIIIHHTVSLSSVTRRP